MTQILEEQIKKVQRRSSKRPTRSQCQVESWNIINKKDVEESKVKLAELESEHGTFKNSSNSLERKTRDEVNQILSNATNSIIF